MQDILSRELRIGDIVVAKGNGRKPKPMDVGMWNGTSVTFRDGKRLCKDIFIVENPSDYELAVKDEIINNLVSGKNVCAKTKTIPRRNYVIGGIYTASDSYKYIYLGQREIAITYYDDGLETETETKQGYCFVEYRNNTYEGMKKEDYILSYSLDVLKHEYDFDYLKTYDKPPKILIDMFDKIDITFPIKKAYYLDNINGEKYKVNITLK